MDTIRFFQNLFLNIHSNFQGIVGDLTNQEWLTRPAPGQNRLGFTAWHIARTQDFFVQTWIRGVPEVAHRQEWAAWRPLKALGVGAGIPLDRADEIARAVPCVDVMAYTEDVLAENLKWLQALDETSLDQIPDPAPRVALFPEYQTPGFRAETDDLVGQPVWGILMRPCTGHIYRHLGEIQVLKDVFRSQA